MIRLERRLSAFVRGDPLLVRAAALAREHGCRILLVGGAVRDLALGRPVADLDFILEGRARAFLSALSRMLGHRIVTFRKRGIVDHRVRAGPREWDFVERGTRTLRAEILRRDFSINALALDPISGRLLDPARGRGDLTRGRLRALSDRTFRDDPLRMLRAVRFTAELAGFRIARRTEALIRRDARLLVRVSSERVKAEMDRILASPSPFPAIHFLERVGLFARILPELDPLRGLEQNRHHHLDAFRHTLAALASADDLRALSRGLPELRPGKGRAVLPPERARILRWALLLHDTGKASTRERGEDGDWHFYMHERASARIARTAMRRLRASRDETAAIEKLVALHLRLSIPAAGEMSPRALRRIARDAADLTPLLVLHSLADKLASHGPGHRRTLASLRRAGRQLTEVWREERERAAREPRFLSGHDVMKTLGIRPGPAVGAILDELEELQGSGDLRSRDEALAWLRERPTGAGA